FREEIVPDTLAGTPQEQPRVVIVSGQTGAGKAAITSLVTTALKRVAEGFDSGISPVCVGC
ncbi:zeta toxin family protein, partial [Streptomyces filamentosus]|uniref:zeta toxin family protein n=1 Tax=Streptomyces filamentosus TaxID=67294 RepID=UPI0033247660